jgi:hypothetical protein
MAFKILKNLRVRRSNDLLHAVPWRAVSRLANRRYKLAAFPVGYAV